MPLLSKHSMEKLDVQVARFSSGEVSLSYNKNVYGSSVFVVQSLVNSAAFVEALLLIEALKRDGCTHVTLVAPYIFYGRQACMHPGKASVQAIAQSLTACGLDHLVTVDLHNADSPRLFPCPVTHISARSLFAEDCKQIFSEKSCVIVSPDEGGAVRAQMLAQALGYPICVLKKMRQKGDVSHTWVQDAQDLTDRICIIIDDMVDSGRTLVSATKFLKAHRAREVHAYATHGVFSDPETVQKSMTILDSLCITDTVPALHTLYRTLSVMPLLEQALK